MQLDQVHFIKRQVLELAQSRLPGGLTLPYLRRLVFSQTRRIGSVRQLADQQIPFEVTLTVLERVLPVAD